MKKKAYVVHETLGHSSVVQYNRMVTIDTGAGPNLIRYDILTDEYKDAIEPFPDPQMC